MTPAVAYYRVSTNKQGEVGYGLAAQQTDIHRFLPTRNYMLSREFTEVESGKKNNRPVLRDALKFCRKHKAVLLIAKLDRLGRRVTLISTLLESKVQFWVVEYPGIDPKENRFFFQVLAAVSELELKHIRARTKAGLAEAKRRGVKLGTYGQELARINRDNAQDFSESLAPLIGKLNRRGIISRRQIAAELNRRCIPTFRAGGRWHPSSVHTLLKRINNIKPSVS